MLRKSPPLYLDTHMLPCGEQTEGRKPTYTGHLISIFRCRPGRLYSPFDAIPDTRNQEPKQPQNHSQESTLNHSGKEQKQHKKECSPPSPAPAGNTLTYLLVNPDTVRYNSPIVLRVSYPYQIRNSTTTNHHFPHETLYTSCQQEPGRMES